MAVRLEPRNPKYVRDLFEFYVDSPEWLEGGLSKARELQRQLEGGDDFSGMLQAAEREYSGPEWQVRKVILRTAGAPGGLLP